MSTSCCRGRQPSTVGSSGRRRTITSPTAVDLGTFQQQVDGVPDVLGQDLFGLVASGGVGSQHARGHPLDNVTDEAGWHPAAVGGRVGGRDRPARVVAQDDDQRAVQHAHAVFDAAQRLTADDMPGGAHDEQVSGPRRR